MDKKTNFFESIILTLAVWVIALIPAAGLKLLMLVLPGRIGIFVLYGLFNIWFYGFLLNRIAGLKLKL